jgi:hypothetical protein
MEPQAVDLHERLLPAVSHGVPCSEVVATFVVIIASLKRWLASHRGTGDCKLRTLSGEPDATFTSRLPLFRAMYPRI